MHTILGGRQFFILTKDVKNNLKMSKNQNEKKSILLQRRIK